MAHNLRNSKSFLSYRVPAWHKLGEVIQDEIGASEAFERIGPFELSKQPLYAEINGEKLTGKKEGIVASFQDGKNHLISVCDKRYNIIQPKDIMSAWDMITQAHVETIGILGEGENVFLSTKLPSYEIKGDEIDNYLLISLPSLVGKSASVAITPVRVVCQNTLSWGLDVAKEDFRVIHTVGAFNRLCAKFKEIWETHQEKSDAVKEAMGLLAEREVNSQMVQNYLSDVLPYPKDITNHGENEAENILEKIDEKRNTVLELFDGKGLGSRTRAFNGTAFGLYNSVVEFVDYFSGYRKNSIVFGSGADLKQKAFQSALSLV